MILVVDDSPTARQLVIKLLNELDHTNILEAANGMEALQLLDRNPQIKLVLLDRYMPKMDGLEFMMQLKQNPKFQYVSVSMITSENDIDEKMKTLSEYKADYYITKPVTKPALVRMFSRLFGD